MELKTYFAQDASGNIMPGATVMVYEAATTTLATGLQDESGSPLSNPFTADSSAKVAFYAPDGLYDITVVGNGRTVTIRAQFVSVDGASVLRSDLAATGGSALVGFQLTAIGSAARTAFGKMSEYVSVRDFGAVGDWNGTTGTDDTAAFVACREHCRVTHAKLRIPSGRYRLTSAWIVGTNGIGPYDGFDIEGDGQECTELVLDFDGTVGVDINPGTGGYTAFANCAVGGFRVFVPPGRSVNVPLYIKNSYNARYHDLHVYAPLASVVSAFVGMRVSGACYFNQFENIWVEVYGGDSTSGKAYYIGNGRGDVGLAGANTSVNTFINCRTRGFGVGFDTVLANGTSFINCDAEVCTSAFRDLSANGSRYINCWQEGSTNGLTVDRTTITNADGSTSMGSGSDYVIVDGGFWESIALDYAYRTRIKARYNSLTTTANTEECDVDALSTSATYTGAGNDVRITKRLTTPIAHTVMSLGSRRYGYEFPNASGPAKLLYWNNGDDVVMGAYRLNTAGSYRGWTQATDGTGAWVLSSWFTSAAIGSESPVQVLKANISGVAFNINPFGATDNAISCGTAGNRWSVVYAGTGTINTSDAREKQQIRELSEAERAVAVRLKSMIRAFKFNDSVGEKGEAARIHFGVIAQDVKAAFESESLVAESYAILCFDKWDAEFDDDGNEIKPAGERYGVRYEELLAFIISAL